MTAEHSPSSEDKGRILQFRRRVSMPAVPPRNPVDDLARYERSQEQDDYRHRMMMNGAALLVVLVLTVVGIWIADTLAEMRKNQDCVLSGRRGCTPVNIAPTPRW
jgi:hypothetical protein